MSEMKPFTELLSDIIDNRGRTCPVSESGIPLIATNCINNDALYPTYEKARYVSQETYETWFRGHPEPGDLIFVTKGSPGRVCMAPDPVDFCIAQDMVAVRPDPEKIYPKYLFAALRSPQVQRAINNMHVGTLIPHFKKGDFDKLDIPVPETDVQEAIGDMYYSLSEKIELNRRMNETLEAIARAIFKSWFVDFDPVRAKASGEAPESICQRLGLTPDLLDLFPDRLNDSELGEIPEGWEVKPLPAVIDVNPARTLRKGTVAPYLDMANMPTSNARALSVVAREFGSGMKFENGDTLVARITPCLENGKTCFVDFLNDGQVGWGSTEYIVLRPKKPLPVEFAYFLARTDTFRNHAIANMTGTSGRQRVPATAFDGFSLVVPSAQLAAEFGHLTRSVMTRMRASDAESGTLSAIRETLLPKLLSGELRVPDAEVKLRVTA